MPGSRFLGVVEAVVGLGEALVVAHHQLRAELVILPPRRFQRRVRLPALGERERLEAVARRVTQVVLQRGAEKARPHFMHSRLEERERRIRLVGKDDGFLVRIHDATRKECERECVARYASER